MKKLAKILCLLLIFILVITICVACSREDSPVEQPDGDTARTDFTEEEKLHFERLFGEVIPFLPASEYSVEVVGEKIKYIVYDVSEESFNDYIDAIKSKYTYSGTKTEIGISWTTYTKTNVAIDVAYYMIGGKYIMRAQIYTVNGTDNPGGGYNPGGDNPGGDNPGGDTPTPPAPPALGFDSSYLVTVLPEYNPLPADFDLKYNVGDDKYRVVRYLGSIYTEIRKLDGAVYNAYILTNDGEYYHYSWDNTSTVYTDNGVLEREEALEKIGVEMFDTVGRSIYGSYLAWAQMSYDCLYGTSTNKVFEIDNTWSYKGNTGTVVPNTRGLENQTHLFYIDKTYGAVLKILDKENDKVIFEHVSLTTATSLGEYSVTNNIIPEVITPPVQPDTPNDTPSGGGTGGVKPEKTTLTSVILGTPAVMDTVYKRSHSKAYEVFENGKIITNMYTEGEIIDDQWYIAYASGDIYKREGDNFVNQSSLKNESFPAATVHLLFHDAGAKQLFDTKYYESVGDELYKVKAEYYEEVLGHFGIVDTEHIKMEEMYMYPIEDGLYFYEEWEESTPTCDTTFWFELEVRYTSETKVDEDKHCINLKVDYNSGMAKLNKFQAKAGETIEITVTCEEGVTLDSITVDGEEISGTSFTMPDHDVLVEVIFDAPLHSGGSGAGSGGTGGTGSGGTGGTGTGGTGGSGSGSDLALIFLPGDVEHGKVITDEYIIQTTTGAKYKVLWEADSIYYTLEYIKVNDANISGDTFIAVAGANTVTIKFKLRDDAPFFNVTCAENQHGKVFADTDTTIPGEIVTLSHECGIGNAFDYYTVNGVKIKGNTFTMPAEDVKVDAVFKVGAVPVYDITAKVEGDTKTTVTTSLSRSDAGREVTFTINLAFRYILDRVTVNGVTVTDYTFTMPAEDATIVVYTIPEPQYTITLDQSAIDAGFDIQLDKTTAYKGETITLTHNETNSNKEFILAVKANDVRYEGDSFIMPAEDVVVTIVTRSVDAHQTTFSALVRYEHTNIYNTQKNDVCVGISGDLRPFGKAYIHITMPGHRYKVTNITFLSNYESIKQDIDDMVKIDEFTYMFYVPSEKHYRVIVHVEDQMFNYNIIRNGTTMEANDSRFASGLLTQWYGGERVLFTAPVGSQISHLLVDGEVHYGKELILPYRDCTIEVVMNESKGTALPPSVYYFGEGSGRIEFDKLAYETGEIAKYKIIPDEGCCLYSVKLNGRATELPLEGELANIRALQIELTFKKLVEFEYRLYLEGVLQDFEVEYLSDTRRIISTEHIRLDINSGKYLGDTISMDTLMYKANLFEQRYIGFSEISEDSFVDCKNGTNRAEIEGKLGAEKVIIEVYYERRSAELRLTSFADGTQIDENFIQADKKDIRIGDTITFTAAELPEEYEMLSFKVEYYDDSLDKYVLIDVPQIDEDTWQFEVVKLTIHRFLAYYDDLRPAITTVASSEGVLAKLNTTHAWAGEEVTITGHGTIPAGYEFSHYTVNGEPIEGNTFIMPEVDVEVSVVLVPLSE